MPYSVTSNFRLICVGPWAPFTQPRTRAFRTTWTWVSSSQKTYTRLTSWQCNAQRRLSTQDTILLSMRQIVVRAFDWVLLRAIPLNHSKLHFSSRWGDLCPLPKLSWCWVCYHSLHSLLLFFRTEWQCLKNIVEQWHTGLDALQLSL